MANVDWQQGSTHWQDANILYHQLTMRFQGLPCQKKMRQSRALSVKWFIPEVTQIIAQVV